MALSPFREKAKEALRLANQFVQAEFQLSQPWTDGNVPIGDREGAILFTTLDRNPDSPLDPAIRSLQRPDMQFIGSLVINVGVEGQEEAFAEGAALLLDIDHTVPLLKGYLQTQKIGMFYDFRVQLPADISYSVPRPSSAVQGYNMQDYWVVRATCDVRLPFILGREKTGAHSAQWANIADM